MKITMLIENELGENVDLKAEHGLALLIEVDGKKILFDTGKTGDFIDNAKQLNVKLEDLDHIVISHGHYDHSGGFERLIKEIKPKAKLHLGQEFFQEKHSLRADGNYQYTGNTFDREFLKNHSIDTDFIKDDSRQLSDSVYIFKNFNRNPDFENTNTSMFLKEKGGFIKDEFHDEIVLGIESPRGMVIVVACSHAGIANIVDSISKRTGKKIYGVLGGTHLVKEDQEKINKIIDYFKELDIKIMAPCHCTGNQGMTMIRQQMEDSFVYFNTGDILEISNKDKKNKD